MADALKRRVFRLLEAGSPDDGPGLLCDWLLITLILANVAAAVAETVAALGARYGGAFRLFEVVSVAIFTVEYAARLWVCTEHISLREHGPLKARLRFAIGPFAVIDLVAILPFYLALLLPMADLRVLRVFRLLRLLKLARYSPALTTLWRVLVDERRALAAALIIMLGLLTVSATAMYYAERAVQPAAFGSIPSAMWWALATLTTVGYGDVVPVTTVGRAIGGLVMIFGLAMFALPIGIVASGFASEIRRRDFVVTWGMVARVPIFAKLDALSVSRITNLLRARVVQPGTRVMRRGETADAMYFIASGEVEIVVEGTKHPFTLSDGDFFGEIALLRNSPRSATARALTRCRLLVLEVDDFNELMAADADLRAAISSVAEKRLMEDPAPHP
jgi:voltage-gated potassium channel